MRARSNREPLELKALYTIRELSAVTGLTPRRIDGLLTKTGVRTFVWGRTVYIPLSELRSKLGPLWQEIREVQRVLAGELD